MIILDNITGCLISDQHGNHGHAELRCFAAKAGLKKEWFQGEHTYRENYDITTPMARKRAISAGAAIVGSRKMGEILATKKALAKKEAVKIDVSSFEHGDRLYLGDNGELTTDSDYR